MSQVGKRKILCVHCEMERVELLKICHCQNSIKTKQKRNVNAVTAISLFALSVLMIVLSSTFWLSIMTNLDVYSFHYETTHGKVINLFAGWVFFTGWYGLLITLPKIMFQIKIA